MHPMIELLRAGGGHPYASLTGKATQRPWRCDDAEIEALLQLCRGSAADQEHVSDDEIRKLAADPLGSSRPAPAVPSSDE